MTPYRSMAGLMIALAIVAGPGLGAPRFEFNGLTWGMSPSKAQAVPYVRALKPTGTPTRSRSRRVRYTPLRR